ncbi:Enterobactin exporter EntS [Streptomyces xanthophaeus]|uniref:MFS transporter n=1 Tax=Streptomyces xanthophaeus TaxID=67385 RepID=UPI00233EC0E3|nr:MFS transporter [Streptomyces xanthophaeus]WCD85939.1 Enterobactin exporter EntS [Streptomyces xanthophaeus]
MGLNRNTWRWLAAYAASLIGDGVYFLALGWAAAQSAGPAEAGLVMAAGAVPRALLMLGGGVVADRFGPRLVVISSDAVRCAVVLALAVAIAVTSPGPGVLVLVALVFGAVDALFMPAVGALPPRIAAPGRLVRVQGLRSLAERVGHTAGPPVAGLAMGLGGPSAAFAVAAALFGVSLVLLLAVRIAPQAAPDPVGPVRESPWHQLRGGIGYIRRHGLIGPLVLSGALSQLGTSAPLTLGLILLAEERGWGPGGIGWIVGAFGAGAASSALVLTLVPRFPRAGAVQNLTLIVGSAGIGALALAPALPVAVVLAVLTGLVCGVCGGLAVALIQSATDPAYLGRVSSVMAFTAVGLAPLAYPLAGAAAALWGVTPVFLAGAALSMTGAAIGTSAPAVRRAELSFTVVPAGGSAVS